MLPSREIAGRTCLLGQERVRQCLRSLPWQPHALISQAEASSSPTKGFVGVQQPVSYEWKHAWVISVLPLSCLYVFEVVFSLLGNKAEMPSWPGGCS